MEACGNKKQYINKEHALIELRKVVKYRQADPGMVFLTYKCPMCHYWHIGSSGTSDDDRNVNRKPYKKPKYRSYYGGKNDE